MRRLFLFLKLVFFLTLFITNFQESFSKQFFISKDDTIQPLPKVDKEFLVVVHIVLDKQEQPNILESEISAALAGINPLYSPIGMSFRICEFRTIENFTYDTLSLDKNYKDEVLMKHLVPHRINIFYVTEFPDRAWACGVGAADGYILMKKANCNSTDVLAHEMGHFFSLPHTFEGNGPELADGSNCKTAGDRFCDTPADPYRTGDDVKDYVDENCLFISQKKDSNGNYYDPAVGNLMSYYPCTCGTFTREQFLQIIKFYSGNPHLW